MRDNDKFWHLDQGVVDNSGDNVETVNDGERDEQLVEWGSHLGTPEHQHDHVFGDNKSDDVLVTKIRRLLAAMTDKSSSSPMLLESDVALMVINEWWMGNCSRVCNCCQTRRDAEKKICYDFFMILFACEYFSAANVLDSWRKRLKCRRVARRQDTP